MPADDHPPPAKAPKQHARVAAELIARIEDGRYPLDTLLPTEHQLSAEFGLSRQTIREALRQLADRGLVTRQPGVGTRVARRSAGRHYTYSIGSAAELEHYADSARLVIDRMGLVEATPELAQRLGCAEGSTWHHIEGLRIRKLDGVPLGLSEIYLRAWFPGVEAHLRQLVGAIHVMLAREYDFHVEDFRQEARAVLLGKAEALRLDSRPKGPAMEVVRRYHDRDGRLVLRGRIVYPADRFSTSMHFRRTPVR
ncbi:GntR family transcriptional regulator [Piscinibacter sakaiensis]|uniref:Transcriptional regulator, GntR family n=1 Tax=Piscinibacter sakaiensis TaxID=1547922 RepID=A0A0K8P633_PISS1|nr:GntR family transcriptional regulator [Piscinibacter sakaiensis]GAP38061.1 transcriptional regulator, GntR family [Piscinibacter sakaiensis]